MDLRYRLHLLPTFLSDSLIFLLLLYSPPFFPPFQAASLFAHPDVVSQFKGAKLEAEECLRKQHELDQKRAILFQIFKFECDQTHAQVLQKSEELTAKLQHETAKRGRNASC